MKRGAMQERENKKPDVVKISGGVLGAPCDFNKQPDDDREDPSAVGCQRFRLQKMIRRSKNDKSCDLVCNHHKSS